MTQASLIPTASTPVSSKSRSANQTKALAWLRIRGYLYSLSVEPEHPGVLILTKNRDGTIESRYQLRMTPPSCECPAFQLGKGQPCKHLIAILELSEGIAQAWESQEQTQGSKKQ